MTVEIQVEEYLRECMARTLAHWLKPPREATLKGAFETTVVTSSAQAKAWRKEEPR